MDENLETAERRVNQIPQGSRIDVDIHISVPKTECMHLQSHETATPPSKEQLQVQCKYTYPNIGCGKMFANMHGLKVHKGKGHKTIRWRSFRHISDFQRFFDIFESVSSFRGLSEKY